MQLKILFYDIEEEEKKEEEKEEKFLNENKIEIFINEHIVVGKKINKDLEDQKIIIYHLLTKLKQEIQQKYIFIKLIN